MLRCSCVSCYLVGATTRVMRCGAGNSSSSGAPSSNPDDLKEKVNAVLDKETKALSRIAIYPHRAITRPVLPITLASVRTPLFANRLMDLKELAKDLNCLSFSAPKAHWDAAVVLFRSRPDEEFEVWVNPSVPGYDDRSSIAPMYGMWENCVSCGGTVAWVVRPQRIHCSGMDEHGTEKVDILDGLRARCLMHELDHLMGKTIFHQTMGPEFVVSHVSLSQRDLWPPNFPSAEAYVTQMQQFFDYVHNTTIIPPGMEWWHAQNMSEEFNAQRIAH